MTRELVVIDIADELTTLAPGTPSRIIGVANQDCLKLSVYEGEGNWHAHPETDEMFLVLDGALVLDIHDGPTVTVGPRQVVTVPAGVIHRPRAAVQSTILCFKPRVSETQYYEMQDAATNT
jgi:mannose-6-phosphate isomerase-like protein (cupin superfamily)